MLEIVFVIVILGILATVAVPKMVATRDDANIAKAIAEFKGVLTELGSYYTIHGNWNSVDPRGSILVDENIAKAGGDVTKNNLSVYSRTLAEVVFRNSDNWNKCFNITIKYNVPAAGGAAIELRKTFIALDRNSDMCKALYNTPLVETWMGGIDRSYGLLRVGGSTVYEIVKVK